MRKTLTDLYNEYYIRYNRNPKHDFSHFIKVIGRINHHITYIKPKIRWWSNI
jgi:hypothetical protein